MRRLILRIRLWFIDRDIATAKQLQERLRHDLHDMTNERFAMQMQLWALDNDQPA